MAKKSMHFRPRKSTVFSANNFTDRRLPPTTCRSSEPTIAVGFPPTSAAPQRRRSYMIHNSYGPLCPLHFMGPFWVSNYPEGQKFSVFHSDKNFEISYLTILWVFWVVLPTFPSMPGHNFGWTCLGGICKMGGSILRGGTFLFSQSSQFGSKFCPNATKIIDETSSQHFPILPSKRFGLIPEEM